MKIFPLGISCLSAWLSTQPALAQRIETTPERLEQVRTWLREKREPFYTYWQDAKKEGSVAFSKKYRPSANTNPLTYHQYVNAQGSVARILAYWWQLERNEEAAQTAIALLDSWASHQPLPGTNLDSKIRFPNAGMDVARGTLPFVVTYDLLHDLPEMTTERKARIEHWFRELSKVVEEGIRRWEENDDFGKQRFQNHHVSHVLGLAIFGTALNDREMVQFALDSPENPKDFKELIAGIILMPTDKPHYGRRGKPLHAGEIQDRYRTDTGAGLTYCHLSMTMLLYAAEVFTRFTGEDYVNWKAPGGEHLQLPFTFYSDFFRTRSATLHGGYYHRDQRMISRPEPFFGIFEVALHHWPDTPNLRAMVRHLHRAKTPRTWLSYYGLPLLTHGVAKP